MDTHSLSMGTLYRIVIVEGITDSYARTLRNDFQKQLKLMIQNKNLVCTFSEDIVTKYKSENLSQLDKETHNSYVYIIGANAGLNEVAKYYVIKYD
jgi:hypothetical protein